MVLVPLSLVVGLTYLVGLLFLIMPYRKTAYSKKLPFVSVLLATKNESSVIEATLKNLKKMNYPRFEIIVIDGSTDSTAKIARKYARVIVEKKSKGKSHALNVGIRRAKGDVVYVIDADSRPGKDTLKNLVAALGDSYEAAVGINLPSNDNDMIARIGRIEVAYLNSVEKIVSRLLKTSIIPGRNYVIYKKTLNRLGGFGDVLTEDLNLSWRLYKENKKVDFVPSPSYEQVPDKLTWYFKQQRRWVGGSFLEMGNMTRHLKPNELFITLPALFFISGTPCITLLALILFLLTGLPSVLAVFILGTLMTLMSEIMYLKKKDVLYFPITFLVLGAIQWLNVADALIRIAFGRKIKWYKTPKEKNLP